MIKKNNAKQQTSRSTYTRICVWALIFQEAFFIIPNIFFVVLAFPPWLGVKKIPILKNVKDLRLRCSLALNYETP